MKYIEEYFKNKNNAKMGSDVWDLGECEQEDWRRFVKMKRIICKDGFEMSVQAGTGMYCTPRVNVFFSHSFLYSELEVGFPSKKEPLLMKWCENSKNPTETVYPYVPVEVINKVIEKHGGLLSTPNTEEEGIIK